MTTEAEMHAIAQQFVAGLKRLCCLYLGSSGGCASIPFARLRSDAPRGPKRDDRQINWQPE